MEEFDQFRKINISYPSFWELYGRMLKKRKRPNGSLQYELNEMENVFEYEEGGAIADDISEDSE